ncbi:unnamed protein product [Caenorhabditis nigoni]
MASRYHLDNWNFTCAIANANSKTKQFILKHTFQNAGILEEGDAFHSEEEEDHFNVKWFMSVECNNDRLGFFIHCKPIATSHKWSIQTNLEFKVVGKNEDDVIKSRDHCYERNVGYGISDFLEWEEMEEEYLINGYLTVEAKVTIIETIGLGKKKLRKFDESQKDVTDVITVVRGTKFYVSKSYLANRSIFFEATFFGKTSEPKESKVRMNDADPNDFHYFLEVLYGGSAIDDSTIEGILFVSDKYSTPVVVRKYQEFLLSSSKKSLEKKLQLSEKYSLVELKTHCIHMDYLMMVDRVEAVFL